MKKIPNIIRIMTLIVFVLIAGKAQAASVLVSDVAGGGLGYGNSNWSNFTNAIGSAASMVGTTTTFTDYSLMLQYDAILLDQRGSGARLGADEAANITAYIQTGRKVLLIGENSTWGAWDADILALVGGTPGPDANLTMPTTTSNSLTAGVNYTFIDYGGTAVGGTSLFLYNWATLWGDNVLTLLDIDALSNNGLASAHNAQFGQNVAAWLADSTPAETPIPAAVWLLGSGLAGLIGIRRMRKA